MIVNNLLWPTSLAVDYATKRLYWCDPKTSTIESVDFDGKNRHVIKHFDNTSTIRPYKLEVFEDNLFVSTYHKHDVIRMNKFGVGYPVYLAHSLTRYVFSWYSVSSIFIKIIFRISDILILQENKRPKLNNSCNDFCSSNEFCLLTPKGARCICPDGYVNDNFTCKAITSSSPECPLNCNIGKCKVC